ncbi:MAG: phosphoglycerate kinase [Saprospiraceae bacterium]|nr:phosphoglycerate kinase [Saprospiraceae bacterium]MBK7736423.1 phosphoglycerate kinase [Saprospiraceae bacterium]
MLQSFQVKDRNVILRVDFNVPIKNGVIQDETRIVKTLPTIQYLIQQGARIIILSHLGRPLKELLPDGSINYGKFSLQPVATKLAELLNCKVVFAKDCGDADTLAKIQDLQSGEILLCENTRFYKQEEKGDVDWASKLAALGAFYINDAFGAAHREHCSTATIARFFDKEHKAFGFLMQKEVENGLRVLQNPQRPMTAIIGGAKVSDKIELISSLMDFCDQILIGGGMAYTFLHALGYRIGNSLCELDKMDLAKSLIEKAQAKNVQLVLPEDSVSGQSFANDTNIQISADQNIPDGYMGLDIGPNTIKTYTQLILNSKTIIWNGPMGVFEMEHFSKGTQTIAEAVAQATQQGAYSLIGGGDSVAAINKYQLQDQVSFVSTGGGAMLEMLEGKQLPGVQAILN